MRPIFFKIIFVSLLACFSMTSIPAYAENKALNALLKVMHENGQQTKEQYEMIMAVAQEEDQQSVIQTEAQTRAIVKEETQAIAKQETKPAVNVATKGKLQFESEDKDFKFRLGGRIMLDGAVYNDDKTPLGNQAEVRRARLYEWFRDYNQ